MSEKKIRAALEERLVALGPALATAYENQNFTPPVGAPYQRAFLLRAEPENPEQGNRFTRFAGIFQVSLFYLQGKGPGEAEARADLLIAHFPRNLTMIKDGIKVQVDGTPYVMPGFADGDRWVVPVRVPYFANVVS